MATWEGTSQHSMVVIRAPARLLALGTAEQFLALAGDTIARHGDVCLDLTEVKMIDACGVGVVAVLLSRSEALGARLRIDASPRVARILKVTGLDACIALLRAPDVELEEQRHTRVHVMKRELFVPGTSVA